MRTRSLVSGGAVVGVIAVVACGSNGAREDFADGRPPDGTNATGATDPGSLPPDKAKPKCDGLECQQVVCDDPNVTTTVTGVVNAPNGTLPLYNAIVYVPNAPLDPLPEGASCDHCGNVSGAPPVT